VLTFGELSRGASLALESPIPDTSLRHWINDAVVRERLTPVIRGVYLNRFGYPAGRLADAASYVRRDAVISLHAALDEAGFINNPSEYITAVLPLDAGPTRPRVGQVKTSAGSMWFRALPRAIWGAGEIEDRLDQENGPAHARATPEKALLDWLYLAHSPRSTLAAPAPEDVDYAAMNQRRLARLTRAMKLDFTVEDWVRGGLPRPPPSHSSVGF
jgi:hypothetical protein